MTFMLLDRATHSLIRATALIAVLSVSLPAAAATTSAAPAPASLAATLRFDISAQPLPRAVLEYSQQSGVQVTSQAKILDGRQSSPVSGSLTAAEALTRLLQGTDLSYDVVDAGTVAIRMSTAQLQRIAQATEPPTPAPSAGKPAGDSLEEVVVTGSNIRQSVEIGKTAIPIDHYSAEQFQSTAGENVADFLRSKPAFTGRNTSPVNDYYGGGESSLNLRGLGDQYTLVLINGRRAAGEDGVVDVGAIPEEAIESVEILKSGSSAIYGANAVGGVVNVKLKQEFKGVDAVLSYGNTTNNDATFKRTALVFGTGTERFHVVGSLAWQDRNGISRNDRFRTRSNDQRPFGGLDNRNTWTYSPFWVEGADDEGNLYTIDGTRFGPGQSTMDPTAFIPGPIEQGFNGFDEGAASPYRRVGGHWSAEFTPVDERFVLFTDGYFDRRTQDYTPIDRPIVGSDGFTPLFVTAGNPNNPFGRDVFVTYFVGPNEYAGKPLNRFKTNGNLLTAGAHGDFGRLGYEVAYTRYEQKVRDTWGNDIDGGRAQAAVDAGDLNPFSYWGNDPDLIASLITPDRSHFREDSLDVISAKLTGSLFALPAGDVQFAVGAERREVEFRSWNDEARCATGSFWQGPDCGSSSFQRKVDGWFGELRVPVYKGDTGTFLSSVEASAATRHERYEDFGSTTIPQGALRFGFFDDSLILRTSYAEGFRAPSLDDLDPIAYPNVIVGVFDPFFNDFVSANVIYGGNPDLVAEVGVTRNIGLVYTPVSDRDLVFTLDYWQVEQTDTIQQPDVEAILRGTQPGEVTRDPDTGIATIDARLKNTGNRLIEGLDLGIVYRTAMHDFGRLTFDFSTSYLTAAEHQFAEFTFEGVARYTDVFGGMPRFRSVLGTAWERGPWSASAYLHYEPGVDEHIPVERTTADYTTADLQVSYEFGESAGALRGMLRGTEIYGGIENLWDERLPFFASTYMGWDVSLHDFRGRYWYTGVRKRF
jgi:iron complex outermembrane receptor protein